MCAKKEQAIKDCKEKMKESHASTINKLEQVMLLVAPVKKPVVAR